jgi:hypothetical protein
MPTLATVAGMAILIYYGDHEPAHFHVIAADFTARIALNDLSVIDVEGRMRAIDTKRLRAWARKHHAALWDNWLRAQRGERVRKIED